ncbi:MAG: hypothetical protein WCG97_03495 [bacterium]
MVSKYHNKTVTGYSTFYQSLAILLVTIFCLSYPLGIISSTINTGIALAEITSQNAMSRIPNAFVFTKDLFVGAQNNEVLMLQILLNSDSRTIVRTSGVGSTGHESNYFGSATENAVERFQTIYKSVILDPIGYGAPTGVIGERSRSVLNQVLNNLRNNRPAGENITIGTSVIHTINTFNSLSTGTSTDRGLPVISTNSVLPDGKVGSYYNAGISSTGGTSSYVWDLISGSLPPGMVFTNPNFSCDKSPCYKPISFAGTPTKAGVYQFVMRVTSGTDYSTQQFSINVRSNSAAAGQQGAYQDLTNTATSSSTASSDSSKSNSTGLIVAGAVVGAAVAVSALSSSASSGGMRTVFGGTIDTVIYCTCTASYLLYIYENDLKSVIQLMFIPGISTLHEEYNVSTAGPLVLGGYTQGGGSCMVYAGTSCTSYGSPIGIIDTPRGVGTSAI